MDIILSSDSWHIPLVYLNDIVMESESPNEHIEHVRQVTTFLNNARIALRLNDFQLFPNCTDCLGHELKSGRLAVRSHKIDAISGLQMKSNVIGLLPFLGLQDFFHRLEPDSAWIAAPLYRKWR